MAKRAKRDTVNYQLKQGNKIVYVGKTKVGPLRAQLKEDEKDKNTPPYTPPDPTARQTERHEIERYKEKHSGNHLLYNMVEPEIWTRPNQTPPPSEEGHPRGE